MKTVNRKHWFTVVSVSSGVDPNDNDSETHIEWVRARTPNEAMQAAPDWTYPVAVFHGRRKGL